MAEWEQTPGLVSIVEEFGDLVWVRDVRTHALLYISDNVRHFLGMPPDVAYTSDAFMAAVHPDDRPRVVQVFEQASDAYSVDFRYLRNGSVRWAHSRGRFVRDETGVRVRIEGCTTDITDRMQREDELRIEKMRAETLSRVAERLSASTTLADAVQMVCEETARALDVTSVVAHLYDPDSGDLVARYGHGLTPAREPIYAPYDVVVATLALRGRSGQMADLQATPDLPFADTIKANDLRSLAYAAFVRGDQVLGLLNVLSYGVRRDFSAHEMALLKGLADQAVGALVNARLSREKEHAEALLRTSERRYREIVESTQDGICILDRQGRIEFANRRLGEILGVPVGELIGTTVFDHIVPDDEARTKQRLMDRMSGDGRRTDTKLRLRAGREIWITATSTPIYDVDAVAGVMLVVSDVTESRSLEEKLQHAQKTESLGVLAGGIAHDFNNLLVSVLGNAGVALQELALDSPVRGIVEDIQTAALRASELTRQLLAYSGKGRFVLAHLDLGLLVEETGNLLSAIIPKNVVLRYSFAENLPSVEGDPTQIRQIVMNLITNASDAIGERDGTVSVRTEVMDVDRAYLADAYSDDALTPGSYVCLEVSDDGVGMSPETRAKIFDPFFSTKFTGRGLGLAAALGILRAHKGAIRVTSELGKGTAFKVLLPAIDAPREPVVAQRSNPSAAWTGSGTILVVDDDENVRGVVRRTLTRHGFDVLMATDGVEAIEMFRKHRDDIRAIVLDLTMPRMGGEEAFRRLREIDPEVRVLLSSGYSEQEATSGLTGAGLAGFVAKPFKPDELIEKIRVVLGE